MKKKCFGFYFSGHPLEIYKKQIENEKIVITYTSDINKLKNGEEHDEKRAVGDGDKIKMIGVITSVKKKYTKNNKLMVTIVIEDLFGSVELLIFENAYLKCAKHLEEDKIVLLNARLAVKEDEVTIFGSGMEEYILREEKKMLININNLEEDKKDKLRSAITFYAKDSRANTDVSVLIGEDEKACGRIYMDSNVEQILTQLLGSDRVEIQKIE